MRRMEVSLLKPAFTLSSGEQFISEAIKTFGTTGAGAIKFTVSAERNGYLFDSMRNALATVARVGRARVARAHIEDDNGDIEVIDLIGDRIKQSVTVNLESNGRASADSIFAALAHAKDLRNVELQAFFG